nr:MAG TPA: hypothetical protein [Caudoviricetes sp.]
MPKTHFLLCSYSSFPQRHIIRPSAYLKLLPNTIIFVNFQKLFNSLAKTR